MNKVNDNLVLVCGEPISGKSASLHTLQNPEGVMYCNCESGKKLPFPSKFKEYIITDPYEIHQGIQAAETMPDIHTVVIDSLTFLMEMYHSKYIHGSSDGMRGWANYQHFFKTMMQEHVAKSTKNVVFTAHVQSIHNEATMSMEKKVPVQGSLAKNGIEAYFSCIVTAKLVTLEALEKYSNPLLTITTDDQIVGYKHVFQTRPTKDTVSERGQRAPMGMWSEPETFINNDCQLLINRLDQFYN